jgi:hypothetical protein
MATVKKVMGPGESATAGHNRGGDSIGKSVDAAWVDS